MMQKIGGTLFLFALGVFLFLLADSNFRLSREVLESRISKTYHREIILEKAVENDLLNKTYPSGFEYISQLKNALKAAQKAQEDAAKIVDWKATAIPQGTAEWDFRIGDGDVDAYLFSLTKNANRGLAAKQPMWMFFLTIGFGILGGLLYNFPKFQHLPGIRNNGIYQSTLTRGLRFGWRAFFLTAVISGVFVAGYFKSGALALYFLVIGFVVAALVRQAEKKENSGNPRSGSPQKTGWLGILIGVLFIGFYVALYWFPEYLSSWILLVDPLSKFLSGNEASQWFLYGFLYTVVILVMGFRMIGKYRNNRYQMLRTASVMFFQTAFAFLIPEILVRLNQPYFDFKNMWPLDYDFFFEWHLNSLIQSGNLGLFMLAWGILLFIVGVPLFTYFYGKRWYCSWVCGCGGLAETMGDPFRQLSDKSLRAWRIERWLVHGVLLFTVVMTALVLYTYFTGKSQLFGFDTYHFRSWYGFLIGSAFAGVVGTGFYPLMGNRVWCRFGCPLAAYLGLIQKFKSRFRITVNGGQCISCGNCSTYCEMGIDVRWYAQRGQDVVRASCVGCGICAAVCPRGVLRLENAAADVSSRAEFPRTIHISENEIRLLS